VEYLVRHAATRVCEAGDALAWSVGNERGTSRFLLPTFLCGGKEK
jgi:hypothetical protein